MMRVDFQSCMLQAGLGRNSRMGALSTLDLKPNSSPIADSVRTLEPDLCFYPAVLFTSNHKLFP